MPEQPHGDCVAFFQALQGACGKVLDETFERDVENQQSVSFAFVADLERWLSVLAARPETKLLEGGIREYQFALLALAQGQYRQAFMALRLFFELSLCAILFSANELHLRTWLKGVRDLNWAAIVDKDAGVLSTTFLHVFFEEVSGYASQYRAIAETVYRECSEFVHGNANTQGALPADVRYSASAFKAWHEKAKNMRLVLSFALCARYLKFLDAASMTKLEGFIGDQLGHVAAIREFFDRQARA